MSSYGLGKLKKSSKNGSKSGAKMEVRGKVGGGRWWWELEKVVIFLFFSVVAKCHEMMGNDVMSVTHDNIRVFHPPNLIFFTMLGMENFRHAPQAKKISGYGVGSGVNRLSFASSFDWRNKN